MILVRRVGIHDDARPGAAALALGRIAADAHGGAVDDRLDRAAQFFTLHHLDVDDIRARCDAERCARDCAGDGGAVRVADFWIIRKAAVAETHAPLQFRMGLRNAAVEDVHRDAVAGLRVRVCLVERKTALIYTVECE